MHNDRERGIASIASAIAALVACALPPATCAVEISTPAGWRRPGPAELAHAWRDTDPSRYAVVVGDFDGNGVEDEARLLLSECLNRLGLFIFLRQVNGSYRTHRLGTGVDPSLISAMGIRKLPADPYTTACGKGYFDCDVKPSREIAVPYSAIEYFKFESYSIYYYWHPKEKKFSRAWISD